MKSIKGMVLAAALAFIPVMAQAQAVLIERTISHGAALEMAIAAQAACRKEGYKVMVTVLNRAGRTSVVLHDDGANPHTIESSLRKA